MEQVGIKMSPGAQIGHSACCRLFTCSSTLLVSLLVRMRASCAMRARFLVCGNDSCSIARARPGKWSYKSTSRSISSRTMSYPYTAASGLVAHMLFAE